MKYSQSYVFVGVLLYWRFESGYDLDIRKLCILGIAVVMGKTGHIICYALNIKYSKGLQ